MILEEIKKIYSKSIIPIWQIYWKILANMNLLMFLNKKSFRGRVGVGNFNPGF